MTSRLSRRQVRYRASRTITVAPAGCDHDAPAWYTPLSEDRVVRTCSRCGAYLEASVLRCSAWLGWRRVFVPASFADRCKAHRR
jgi:hypothetical protein